MHPAYLGARLNEVRVREGSSASQVAREDKRAILGALADLGLPENAYVRDPSRPRSALYLYRDSDGRHEIGYAPWRLARHAPLGVLPDDVRRVGRELRRGLTRSLLGAGVACLGAFLALLFSRAFVPSVPPEHLSPAAYVHAAPVIFGCVAVLCFAAAFWYFAALLFPRDALAEDAQSRAAFVRAVGREGEGA